MTATLDSIAGQLTAVLAFQQQILQKVNTLNLKADIIMTAQDDIDAATSTIEAEVAAEQADLQTEADALSVLQAYIVAHPDAPNLEALQAAVGKLSAARAALDTETAAEVAAEPAAPVAPPAP